MIKKFFKDAAALLAGTLVLFVVLEAVFRLVGPAGANTFVEKVIIEQGIRFRKSPGEFRIFTFGESTMQGAQYAPVSSPARWLNEYLKDLLPGRKVTVGNLARIGSGAHFNYRTFRTTLEYRPDLVIFYLGHNGFLPGALKDHVEEEERAWSTKLRRFVLKSHLVATLSRWVLVKRVEAKSRIAEDKMEYDEVETPPSGIGPENAIPRNTPVYRENVEFFRENILKIIRLARERNIPVIFLKPVSNIKDFAPYYSVHMKELSPEESQEWERWFEEGRSRQAAGDLTAALAAYEKAHAIDGTYAELSFRLAQICFGKGELEKAKKFFEEARDNDGIIFRATREILDAIAAVTEEEKVPLVDMEKIISSESPGGIPGEPIIIDNAHFSLKGQAMMARALAQEIADRELIAPKGEWRFENERPFEEMCQRLGVNDRFLVQVFLKTANYFGSRFDNRIRFARQALNIDDRNEKGLRQLAWSYWLKGDRDKSLETYLRLREAYPEVFERVLNAHPEIRSALGPSLDKPVRIDKDGIS